MTRASALRRRRQSISARPSVTGRTDRCPRGEGKGIYRRQDAAGGGGGGCQKTHQMTIKERHERGGGKKKERKKNGRAPIEKKSDIYTAPVDSQFRRWRSRGISARNPVDRAMIAR